MHASLLSDALAGKLPTAPLRTKLKLVFNRDVAGKRISDEIVTFAIPVVMECGHPGAFYESLFNCAGASGGYL
jgi:hypothetical protein